MAFTVTQLANVNSTTAAQSQTTASLSIPASSVVLVFACGANDFSSNWSASNEIVVTDSVDGATGWTAIGAWATSAGDLHEGGQLFYKKFTGSTSRTITMDRAGTLQSYWGIEILAVTGADTTTPVVQTKSSHTYWGDAGNTHTDSVTLDSAPTSGNCVVWFCCAQNNTAGAKTLPSGYTSVINPTAVNIATAAAYHLTTTTAAISSSDLGDGINWDITFATELKLAGAAAVVVKSRSTNLNPAMTRSSLY